MAMEVMDCDLHRVIQSKQALSEKHHKCFIKQILEGIKAMHSIGVFHRDLKPGNILVSKDCQLRITDFGLARFMDDKTRLGNNQLNPMTEYVVTRWYRPPELLLSPNRPYSEAIDLWSIGCILAELIRRKPLFPGKSHANQVSLIFEVMGFNDTSELGFPVSQEASQYLDKRCRFRRQPFRKVKYD
jgi:serine/threonine protein kinase